MIVKTAREILQQAKTLANADNSAFTNFFLSTTLLNNAYRDIYDKISNNSLAFSKVIELSEDTVLPPDFFAIQSVRRLPSNTLLYQRQLGGSTKDEGWSVQNGVFQCSHYPVEVTYIPVPATITAPDKRKQITTFIYNNTEYSEYPVPSDSTATVIDNEDDTVTIATGSSRKAGDYSYDSGIIYYNGEVVTDYFSREDHSISHVAFHMPYIAVSYDDGVVLIFSGNTPDTLSYTEYNYNCITGHETRGVAYALTTNDQTGFGLVFYDWDDNKYYYSPFVPDTVLSYPTNALFTYLEYKVAFIIAGLLNMDTGFIEKQLDKAEVDLFTNIGGTTNVRRINNYQPARRIWTA